MTTGVRTSDVSVQSAEEVRRVSLWPAVALLPLLLAGTVLKPAGIVAVAGLDLTVAGVGLLVIAGGIEVVRGHHFPFRALLPIAPLVVVVLISIGTSEVGEYQSRKVRDLVITSVIVACIPLLIRRAQDLRTLAMIWTISGVTAIGFVWAIGGSEKLYGREGIGTATLGPAYVAAAGFVAAISGWRERLIPWPLAVPTLILTFAGIMAIGSRGPLVAGLVGAAVWLFLRGLGKWQFTAVVLAVGAAFLVGSRFSSEAALDRLQDFNDPSRQELRAIAWEVFLDNPILGVGWGNYSATWADYPHNLLFEAASELGVLGLFAVVVVLAAAARRTWCTRHLAEVRVVASVAAAGLVGQQFSSDITHRFFWIGLVPTLLLTAVMGGESKHVGRYSDSAKLCWRQSEGVGRTSTPQNGHSLQRR